MDSHKIKRIFISIICLVSIFAVQASVVWATTETGLDETTSAAFGTPPFGDKPLSGIIGQIVGAALSLIATLFMVLLIYGGFIWMTARGNESEVTKAKDMITAAIIGLVIVLSAYAITKFIGSALFEGQEL
jgi:hypothetical protein